MAQTLAWASSFYLPAVIADQSATDLGLSVPWIYAGLSLALAVSALFGPAVGRRIDLGYGRFVLCFSNIAFAIGLACLGLAQGPATLLLSWMVLGVAMSAGLYEPAFSVLTVAYGRDARRPITGITLIAGFASTIGWPVSGALTAHLGWRETCAVWALLHLTMGIALNLLATRPREAHAATDEAVAAHPTAARLANGASLGRNGYLLMVAFSAVSFVSSGVAALLPSLFAAAGATPGASIAAASLMGPAQVAARLFDLVVRRHGHPIRSARLACAAQPSAAIVLALLGAPAIGAFAILYGASNGVLTIARGTLPLTIFGPHGYGARIGKIASPGRVCQALAPFLFGLAISRFGLSALLITSLLSLSAFAALLMVRVSDPSASTTPHGEGH